MLENFALARLGQDNDSQRRRGKTTGKEYTPPIAGKELADFVDHCLEQGFMAETLDLLQKFGVEVDTFDARDFVPMVIPFLCSLTSVLSKHGISPDEDLFHGLYQKCLDLFLRTYVKKAPLGPENWERPRIECLLRQQKHYPAQHNCMDCQILEEFLRDPETRVFNWLVSKGKHLHLTKAVTQATSDVSCRSVQSQEGWRLVVVKTNNNFEEELAEWRTRKDVAARWIAAFDTENLKKLLGDQFQNIVEMKNVEPARPPGPIHPGRTITDVTPRPRVAAFPPGEQGLPVQPLDIQPRPQPDQNGPQSRSQVDQPVISAWIPHPDAVPFVISSSEPPSPRPIPTYVSPYGPYVQQLIYHTIPAMPQDQALLHHAV
jgi:hypothetical protein